MVKSTKKGKLAGIPSQSSSKLKEKVVANVNKPTTAMRTRSSSTDLRLRLPKHVDKVNNTPRKVSTKRKISGKVVFDEMTKATTPVKRSKGSRKTNDEPAPSTLAEVEFCEDNQVIQMHVDAGDESLFDTESSENEEEEVQPTHSSQETREITDVDSPVSHNDDIVPPGDKRTGLMSKSARQ